MRKPLGPSIPSKVGPHRRSGLLSSVLTKVKTNNVIGLTSEWTNAITAQG